MYLAIDIGGTKTLVALFHATSDVPVRSHKFPTSPDQSQFQSDLLSTISGFNISTPITQTVVAIPGCVVNNNFTQLANLPWQDFHLTSVLAEQLNCTVTLENDASLATLFEGFDLPGRSIYLTFSTGIGGGILEQNNLLPESSTFEPGHLIFDFRGKVSEWEQVASARAIGKDYHSLVSDIASSAILSDIATRLALGLNSLARDYHPDRFIIGGPLALIFSRFIPYLHPLLDASFSHIEIIPAKTPLESVIYGCKILASSKN